MSHSKVTSQRRAQGFRVRDRGLDDAEDVS